MEAMMHLKEQYYLKKITCLKEKLDFLKKRNKYYSFFRLLIVGSGIVLFYLLLPLSTGLAITVWICSVIIFVILVIRYTRIQERIERFSKLILILENELNVLFHGENKLFTDGKAYLCTTHPYANDLDVFGANSIFHYINRCVTRQGQNILAAFLSEAGSNQEIESRQEAIKELAPKSEWRSHLILSALTHELEKDDPKHIIDWVNTSCLFSNQKFLLIVISVLPLFTVAALILSFLGTTIPFGILVSIHFLILYFNQRKIKKEHELVSQKKNMLRNYSWILESFEKEDWKSEKLKELKKGLLLKNGFASPQIKKLSFLVHHLDQRLNLLVQFLINLLTFYDMHLLFQIYKWKQKNGSKIKDWFDILGEIEALASIANLAFNHEDWCFPEISEHYFRLEAKEIAHPLLTYQQRIANDYELKGKGVVHLITGSNMAGKSTFLRTIGVNVLLALAGAPVCAKRMLVSNVEIYSVMRNTDSIQENESSFYAELKRIQKILKKVSQEKQTLLLFDEILKGTNSKDKHAGSVALIEQLIKYEAVAVFATHDLELSNLEEVLPDRITNFFFDMNWNENQMVFNYKLNNGICKTFNAPFLMKEMGIEFDEAVKANGIYN